MGPYQPIADNLLSKHFPTDKNGRRFSSEWYWFILPDSKSVKKRKWLSYFPTTDCAYCLVIF